MIRSNEAPFGTALNCTAAAVIQIIASEGFYREFKELYKDQIMVVMAESLKIHRASTAYHIIAGLYGARSICSDLNTESATSLAAISLCYVRSLGKEAPISGQKVLTKPGDNNPGIVQRVENYLPLTRRAGNAVTLRDALL